MPSCIRPWGLTVKSISLSHTHIYSFFPILTHSPSSPPSYLASEQDSMGKGDPNLAAMGQFNWLCTSHVADNPIVVVAAAVDAGCNPRAAVEVSGLLPKEREG
jgi:hypothetical protein